MSERPAFDFSVYNDPERYPNGDRRDGGIGKAYYAPTKTATATMMACYCFMDEVVARIVAGEASLAEEAQQPPRPGVPVVLVRHGERRWLGRCPRCGQQYEMRERRRA